MARTFRAVFVVLTLCMTQGGSSETWYVDGSVSAPGDGMSCDAALKTIQEGIDAASDGDTVVVAQGTYAENIHFNGKNIVLTSTDPLDPSVVAKTIIDGRKVDSVVAFSGTETEACVLSGFTIRNGSAYDGGGIYGGEDPVFTQATIENNTITGNSAGQYYGGGLYRCNGMIENNTITANSAGASGAGLDCCNGMIQNNTITGNSALNGGGLYDCDGTIRNNTIMGNSAIYDGGGLYDCDGTIRSNTITGNSAKGGGGGLRFCFATVRNNTISGNSAEHCGGGLYSCDGTIQDNAIAGNSAKTWGGGLSYCRGIIRGNVITGNSAGYTGGGLQLCVNGTIENNLINGNSAETSGGGLFYCSKIQNNTIVSNWAGKYGGGLYDCDGIVLNCIIWENTAPSGPQLHESSIPTYSCIQEWSGGGEGNIASEPRFLDLSAGDYRLQECSPCIDAGYNDPELPATDIAGMRRIMYGGKSLTVDMGAYEYDSFFLKVREIGKATGGAAELTWSSRLGDTYVIWSSSDLSGKNPWTTREATVPSQGETTSWTDPDTTSTRKFYRIGIE